MIDGKRFDLNIGRREGVIKSAKRGEKTKGIPSKSSNNLLEREIGEGRNRGSIYSFFGENRRKINIKNYLGKAKNLYLRGDLSIYQYLSLGGPLQGSGFIWGGNPEIKDCTNKTWGGDAISFGGGRRG